MKQGRVGVLLGGDSSEREISIRSGKAIAAALRSQGIDIVEIGEKEPVREGVLTSSIDVAFIALHGKGGEDGTIQQFLEDQAIPYTGTGVEASRLAIDKIRSKQTFIKKKVTTPRFDTVTSANASRIRVKQFPVVIKPSRQGSSIGVTIVRQVEELPRAIETALQYDTEVLVEEFVSGRELTVGILGDQPLPVVEIRPKSGIYDYTSKYTVGMTEYLVPAPLVAEEAARLARLGLQAHRALGCRDLSRVDILLDAKGGAWVLEVNTIPGFTQTSLLPKAAAAAGISFEKLCWNILELAALRGCAVKTAASRRN